LPYLKNIYGKGAMARVKNARREVAHWSPNLSYICMPKSGNTAATELVSTTKCTGHSKRTRKRGMLGGLNSPAKVLRAKLLAAKAEAAYSG
jgi:hypothetical protein